MLAEDGNYSELQLLQGSSKDKGGRDSVRNSPGKGSCAASEPSWAQEKLESLLEQAAEGDKHRNPNKFPGNLHQINNTVGSVSRMLLQSCISSGHLPRAGCSPRIRVRKPAMPCTARRKKMVQQPWHEKHLA